jgi:hypothetical protein
MSLEEQEGVVDRLTEKGVVLSGTWFGFSKHLKGPKLTEAHLGHKVTVLFHTYMERPYIDIVRAIGEKVPGWKPPENPKNGSWGGGGRRLSPEELALKRDEGVRIARSVAVDRAIALLEKGLRLEKIAPLARVVEGYLLTGSFSGMESAQEKEAPAPPVSATPTEVQAQAPSDRVAPAALPAPAKETRSALRGSGLKRPDPKAVNALFNEAKRAGFLSDWSDYLTVCREMLRSHVKSPYGMTVQEFARVEADLRGRLARGKVA